MFPAPYGEEAPDPAAVGEEELLAVLTSYPTFKLEKTLVKQRRAC